MIGFDPFAASSQRVPVLMVDTCSLLDIMRDPTRDGSRVQDRSAAIDLAERLERGDLACLVAEQVEIEFAAHDADIQLEAERAVRKLRERVEQVSSIHAAFLPAVPTSLIHLDKLLGAARAVVDRWLNASQRVSQNATILGNAMGRVNGNIAPSKKGKDSFKDCVVFETYLAALSNLRAHGMPTTAVFLSSNTREYLSDGNVLQTALVPEFSAVGLKFAPNMSAAKAFLGF